MSKSHPKSQKAKSDEDFEPEGEKRATQKRYSDEENEALMRAIKSHGDDFLAIKGDCRDIASHHTDAQMKRKITELKKKMAVEASRSRSSSPAASASRHSPPPPSSSSSGMVLDCLFLLESTLFASCVRVQMLLLQRSRRKQRQRRSIRHRRRMRRRHRKWLLMQASTGILCRLC